MIKENHCTGQYENDRPYHFVSVNIIFVVFIDVSIYRVYEIEFFIVVLYTAEHENRDNNQANREQESYGNFQDVSSSNIHFRYLLSLLAKRYHDKKNNINSRNPTRCKMFRPNDPGTGVRI